MIPKREWLACGLVFAAVSFNMVLCFLNTHVVPVNESHVIASEALIVGLAGILSYRFLNTKTLTPVLLFLAYLSVLWFATGTLNPRTIRFLLIPAVFFALGSTSANSEDADKLVYSLIIVVLIIGFFEWLFPERFLQIFDILSYYVAKGGLDEEQAQSASTNFYLSGTRIEDAHQSLEILGGHRVSSIFLEPVTVGNFATIAFMWLWLRHGTRRINSLYLGLCALLILMSDSRFAMFSSATLLVANSIPVLRSRMMIFAMPFVFASVLVFFASILGPSQMGNSLTGRLVISGMELRAFDVADWFGDFGTKLGLENSDAGYAYVINRLGLIGCTALWMLFSASTPKTKEAVHFKTLVAIYVCLSLSIGEAFVSIKTAALLWFLYGASQSRGSEKHEQWTLELPERLSSTRAMQEDIPKVGF